MSSTNADEPTNQRLGSSLLDLTVGHLLEQLGSPAPAPGGGAGAALAGAMGAALVQMTANLTIGRPRLLEVEPQARDIEARAGALRGRLAALGDADAQAFEQVSAAYQLPREDEAQKQARSEAIQASLHGAAAVPLSTAQLCAEVLRVAEAAAPVLNSQVISDVLVGALLAQAALESAALNVEVNVSAMTDAATAEQFTSDLAAARAGASERVERILASGRARFSKPARKS